MLQLSRAALCRSFVVAAFTLFPRSTTAYFSTMSTTARDGSGTITVSPKNEADQSGLVVICHGLGDTAEGFADVAEVKSIWKL
jgi:alpha-beta hydrolase superfamily lysophospholipase